MAVPGGSNLSCGRYDYSDLALLIQLIAARVPFLTRKKEFALEEEL